MALAISQCHLKPGKTWVVVWRGSQGSIRGAKTSIWSGRYVPPCPVEVAIARDPDSLEYMLLLRMQRKENP